MWCVKNIIGSVHSLVIFAPPSSLINTSVILLHVCCCHFFSFFLFAVFFSWLPDSDQLQAVTDFVWCSHVLLLFSLSLSLSLCILQVLRADYRLSMIVHVQSSFLTIYLVRVSVCVDLRDGSILWVFQRFLSLIGFLFFFCLGWYQPKLSSLLVFVYVCAGPPDSQRKLYVCVCVCPFI